MKSAQGASIKEIWKTKSAFGRRAFQSRNKSNSKVGLEDKSEKTSLTVEQNDEERKR